MSYMEPVTADLSDAERTALELSDSGMSTADIAERIGKAVGHTGNLIRTAKRKSGREAEIRAGGGGGSRTPKAVDIVTALEQVHERAVAVVHALEERLASIDEAASATPKDILAKERDRRIAAVERATAMLDEFDAWDKAAKDEYVSTVRESATAKAAESRSAVEAELDKARNAAEQAASMVESARTVTA